MTHNIEFAGLSLDVTVQTEPAVREFSLAAPGTGQDGIFEWVVEFVDLEVNEERLLVQWSLRRRDGTPFQVQECTVSTGVPAVDVHRVFVPVLHDAIGKHDYISLPWGVDERSFSSWSFPYFSLLSRDDVNRFSMGFTDHIHTAHVRYSCYDRNAELTLSRPGPDRAVTEWRDGLYLSRAPAHMFDEVRAFARAYDRFHQITIPGAPPAAWDPVWCSWYGIGGDVDAEYIRRMAPLLAEWGFGSIIVDDGWFLRDHFDEATGHYAVHEPKFPDLPELIDEVRGLGLRILLWCAPIFRVGEIAAQPFIRDHLYHPEGQERPESFLCPRCPTVREYAVRTVRHVMETYGPDGLKVDFIDPLQSTLARPCQADHAHDFDDVGEAVHTLLTRIHAAITDVRADALIEFRMNYATLATRPFATSHRAQDAPFDFDHIRRMCTRLRSWILNPEAGYEANVAPHTDPAYWLPDESLENVARFMASLVTSAVPMMSMNLHALPKAHQRLVAAWIGFYRENRDLLMLGTHRVLGADAHHSLFSLHRGDEALWGVFATAAPGLFHLPHGGIRRLQILNGTSHSRLCCRLTGWQADRLEVCIFNRDLGQRCRSEVAVETGEAVVDVAVEVGGLVELTVY